MFNSFVVRAALVALISVTFAREAVAFEWGLELQAGMAAPAGNPQSRLFGPGFGGSLTGLIGIIRYLDFQAGVTQVSLPVRAGPSLTDVGAGWGYGVGLRLRRPHDLPRGYSPWVDGEVMYVRTGDLNRVGFTFGAGLSSALDWDRRMWLGPFVRYFQIVQGERVGADNTDAKIFIVGASLELGPKRPRHPHAVLAERDCVPRPVLLSAAPSDRDGDGVPDSDDLCPDVAGPYQNHGCPVYEKLVVKPGKLELKEKIFFAWDKALIEPQSYPLLDEVARALVDNKSFQVRIEGHTDSSGPEAHNQTLSEERARAVLDYLGKHGVATARLGYKGFSSSQPLETNDTVAGREANRRVEFVVELVIVNVNPAGGLEPPATGKPVDGSVK